MTTTALILFFGLSSMATLFILTALAANARFTLGETECTNEEPHSETSKSPSFSPVFNH